jgi:serine/threonine protein kinase
MAVREILAPDSYLYLTSSPANPVLEASVKAVVDVLHQGGFVHDDIRDSNVAVNRNWDEERDATNIKLIEFDWVGREGATVYPANINSWYNTERTIGARDGMPVTKEHDLVVVAQMFNCRAWFVSHPDLVPFMASTACTPLLYSSIHL